MVDCGCQVLVIVRLVFEVFMQCGDVLGVEDDISLLVLYMMDFIVKDVKDIEELIKVIDKFFFVIIESSDLQVVVNVIVVGVLFCQLFGVNVDRFQFGVFGVIEVYKWF